MARAHRLDHGNLRKPQRTPQGFLRVDGYASRIGVFEYRNADGTTRRELRPPEEVFGADALAGFEGAPLTHGHPSEPVTADNVRRYEVGTVTGPARRDGDHVAASIVVKDPAMIAKLEQGATGLSVGYDVDLDETPGVHPQWGRYDAIQRNIVVNHLAVGVDPRAGHTARVRMDAAEQVVQTSAHEDLDRSDASPEHGDMKTDKQRADEAEAMVATLRTEVVRLEGLVATGAAAAEADAIKSERTRADEAEAKVTKLGTELERRADERAQLRLNARAVLGETFRCDGLTDRQVQEAMIKRLDSSVDPRGENDDQVRGRYVTLVELHVRNAASQARVGEILAKRNDGTPPAPPAPSAYEDHVNNAWRRTLNPDLGKA